MKHSHNRGLGMVGLLTASMAYGQATPPRPPAANRPPSPAAAQSVQTPRLATSTVIPPPDALSATAIAGPATPAPQHLARVKDIASIEGIRDNQLVGYGIVVGLHGTGDSQQTTFPIQTLVSTLLRMGVSVPASAIKVQNLAAVFISATLPPFSRPGTKLDITIGSAGDAQSLEGGMLLLTPLYGPDGKIYAEAQGPLVVGGYALSVNGNTKQYTTPLPPESPREASLSAASPSNSPAARASPCC